MSKDPINRNDPFQILESLNQVGVALSSETRLEYLLEMILERAIEIIHADGGTLYTLTKENTLKFSIIRNSSLNIRLGGGAAAPINFPDIPLFKNGIKNTNAIASLCALTKQTVNVEDAYAEEAFEFSGAKAFDEKNNYRTRSVLAVPLINHEGKVLGVLQLINCLDSENKPTKFDDFSVKVAESLSSQAAISLQNRLLINQFILEDSINRNDPFQILESLNQVGVALSSETRLEYLLEMILERAIEIIHADGGTLYTLTKENTLKFSIIRNSSLSIRLGGGGAGPINFPEIPLFKDGIKNTNAIASYCALTKQTINVEDAYTAEGFDFSGAKAFDEKNNYRTRSVLAVPLINHEEKVLGVLQLINCLDSENKPTKFDDFSVKVAESLSSQAAISLQNRLLINQLEGLFEGVTNLINTAIDEKSPYTGGHCLRVPELTLMIADAVNSETEGPLAGFQMTDKDRYELKIAGMLHDCGKITTPVHVVDKATKLETIVDRISMVESKSEILRKEAWIDYWKGMNKKASSADNLKETLEARLQQIDDEFDFLRKCNIGGERMQQEDIERLKQIGQQTWVDKNNEVQPYLTDNEIYNLSIPAGTLTKEEREIINYHIVATIKLLEQMDWPDHLKNVTEYAGGHHEKMDGTGYPKGLKRDQMSLQARMMGIADIFEALTASDRPYKKGMPLSQCISIMQRMKQEAHIDPDLFDVFIKHRLHIEYAKKFLKPEQIDME